MADASLNPLPLWHRAATFAICAHAGQMRKDGRTPYFVHCARVAQIVAADFGCTDDVVLATAYLHDVIEDTPADYDDLAERFGTTVADYVALLTKDMRVEESEREEQFDAALAGALWPVRLVKLADVCDNMLDAPTEAMLRSAITKAERALAMPGEEPELQTARDAVKNLTAARRAELA